VSIRLPASSPVEGGRRLTYGRGVTTRSTSTAASILIYTVLRVALFAVVWAVVWFLTPLDAVWSAMAAILISGALSVVLLDRQRGRVGTAAGRFFSRLNDRIDASTRAEDLDEDYPMAGPGSSAADGEEPAADEAVGEQK